MLSYKYKQYNLHSILYNRIPKNNILLRINKAVDLKFINELLEGSYCKYYGRPAKEPEMMVRILILQYLYNLSYMYFIGINPDDDLPDPSLLAKFRTQRLKETSLDDIIKEIVKQCVDRGIIEGSGVSIDTTHIEANTIKKVPERMMKHLARKIFKAIEKDNTIIPETIDTNIPDYKKIEDHKEAKELMKNYLTDVIGSTESSLEIAILPETKSALEEAKEILASPKFIEQKGMRSLIDKDARVGRKSKTQNFFGYKAEFTMLSDDHIITSIEVNNGVYVDGTDFNKHFSNTLETGLKVTDFFGDKAYFRKHILEGLEGNNIEPYIPVSLFAFRMDSSKYKYNKDSDQWICSDENYSEKRKYFKNKNGREGYKYYFRKEDCMNCSRRTECYNSKSSKKILTVGKNFALYDKYSKNHESEEFKQKYRSRASIENKNAELKRFHGMKRAKGYSLKSVRRQVKLTALAVNLKKIAKLAV